MRLKVIVKTSQFIVWWCNLYEKILHVDQGCAMGVVASVKSSLIYYNREDFM